MKIFKKLDEKIDEKLKNGNGKMVLETGLIYKSRKFVFKSEKSLKISYKN